MTNQQSQATVGDSAAGKADAATVPSNAEHRRAVLEAPVVLRVRDLEKSFQGLHAVNAVSFDLHEGEIISIIGPNGSGKSTTINLISGFIAPDSGIIDIDNNPVAGLSAAEVADRGAGKDLPERQSVRRTDRR
ncbi:ATP-binding cassette domain-containing protein [Bifidobacterium crudilactis]|uniref:ATP-binding cassette domain-containing protein n=1 Tax=Bifidobacterium crudilactis TaxID=327277 RepID=UPI00055611AE|nr:ATP-binding cassette domain-containing protein [Bifidobacterium crudilactis]